MTVAGVLFVLECAAFALVAGIGWWAFSARRREEFERAARLPFEYDANPVDESRRQ